MTLHQCPNIFVASCVMEAEKKLSRRKRRFVSCTRRQRVRNIMWGSLTGLSWHRLYQDQSWTK